MSDLVDDYPLDPTRSQKPAANPNDTTPPGAVRLQAYGVMHVRLFRLEEFIKELG